MLASPPSNSASLIGQVLAQRYRVEAELGKGGMGVVYRARHVHMQHAVALKVLHRELAGLEEVVERFAREAIAGGRIRHPNVVTATDFGKLEDGSHYLVLDYVDGRSLSRILKDEGVLSLPRSLRIVRQIASALEAAHAVGVVHRDLKPDNVMLVNPPVGMSSGDVELVKVLDFGIAKLASAETGTVAKLTKYGAVFGTPEYMSPEQAAGKGADPRSDLYSLGILWFESLTGISPFEGEDILAILTRQITEPPPELPASFPPAVRDLMRRLLAKEVEERPASASALLSELDALIESTQAPTASPAPLSVPQRWNEAVSHVRARTTVLLSQRVRIGGRQVPLGAIAIAALVLGGFGVVALRSAPQATPSAEAPLAPLLEVRNAPGLDKIRAGDPAAIAEAERNPDADDAAFWLALGRGQFTLKADSKALESYQKALQLKPELSALPELAGDLFRLLVRPDVERDMFTRGVEFAAKSLGAPGADMLYQLQREATLPEERQEIVRRLFESDAKAHASEALGVLLEMNQAKTCERLLALLPKAQNVADARSEDLLKRRTNQRGCGFLRRRDCYPCLRGNDALANALRAAAARPKPKFERAETPSTGGSSAALPAPPAGSGP